MSVDSVLFSLDVCGIELPRGECMALDVAKVVNWLSSSRRPIAAVYELPCCPEGTGTFCRFFVWSRSTSNQISLVEVMGSSSGFE